MGPAALQVDPRHVTVAVDNKTRVYGSPNPTFTTTVTGMPAGMTLLPSFEPVPSDLPVGTWKIKYQRPDDHNLVIDVRAGTLTTTPAPLTITASRQDDRLGDGPDGPRLALDRVGLRPHRVTARGQAHLPGLGRRGSRLGVHQAGHLPGGDHLLGGAGAGRLRGQLPPW